MLQKNIIFRFIVMAAMLIAAGCADSIPVIPEETEAGNQPIESAPSDTSTPITTHMILSGLPNLNEPVELSFVASTVKDAKGTEIEIILPEDAVLISGELHWSGNLLVDQPKTIKATIEFTALGNKQIMGKALSTMDNGDVWGDAAYIYFHITENGSFEGFESGDTRDINDASQE